MPNDKTVTLKLTIDELGRLEYNQWNSLESCWDTCSCDDADNPEDCKCESGLVIDRVILDKIQDALGEVNCG